MMAVMGLQQQSSDNRSIDKEGRSNISVSQHHLSEDYNERFQTKDRLLQATTTIISSFVQHNICAQQELPLLVQAVHQQLSELLYKTVPASSSEHQRHSSTIPARKLTAREIAATVTPDYIVCLEDGKKLRMLKRYLRSHYNMTVEQYKQKWSLPDSYPTTAPALSQKRSQVAKQVKPHKTRYGIK